MCPRDRVNSNSKQLGFFALVFAQGGHVARAHQRHHRELQPFAGVHGQHLDGVGGRVEAARAALHLVGQAALAQHAGAFVNLGVVPADDGNVAPGVAFLVGGVELVFHPLGGAALARRHARDAGAKGGNECGRLTCVVLFPRGRHARIFARSI